jgi:hypothetical protein
LLEQAQQQAQLGLSEVVQAAVRQILALHHQSPTQSLRLESAAMALEVVALPRSCAITQQLLWLQLEGTQEVRLQTLALEAQAEAAR